MRAFSSVMAGLLLLVAVPARAGTAGAWQIDWSGTRADGCGRTVAAALEGAFSPKVTPAPQPVLTRLATYPNAGAAQGVARTKAFEYSDGYRLRAKIHKVASLATLPLFGAEWYLGNKLFNLEGTDATRSAHGAVAATIGGLFAVNTVTGVWNLLEARKDPNGRTRRLLHGVLLLVADAGFVATGALAPENEQEDGGFRLPQDPTTHRNVAYFSMGTATISYLMMLLK